MNHRRQRQALANHSILHITCLELAAPHNDFIQQYS